jgi:hypothetical protein
MPRVVPRARVDTRSLRKRTPQGTSMSHVAYIEGVQDHRTHELLGYRAAPVAHVGRLATGSAFR